jgi:hypothetical protein
MVRSDGYVPDIVTDTPALRNNPVFLSFHDRFTRPQPFRPDIVIAMCTARRLDMLDAHVSQFYEWLPWHAGLFDQVSKDPVARK